MANYEVYKIEVLGYHISKKEAEEHLAIVKKNARILKDYYKMRKVK